MINNTSGAAVLLEQLADEDGLSNKQLCIVELANGTKVPYYYPIDSQDIESMFVSFAELNQLIKKIYLLKPQYDLFVAQFKERMKYSSYKDII